MADRQTYGFDPYSNNKAKPAPVTPFGFDADPFAAKPAPKPARRLSNQGRDLLGSVLGGDAAPSSNPFELSPPAPAPAPVAADPFADPFAPTVNTANTADPFDDPFFGSGQKSKAPDVQSDSGSGEDVEDASEDSDNELPTHARRAESIEEYEAFFPAYQKLGMLLQEGPFSTVTVVKKVFSGSIAESQGVTAGR